LDRDAQKALNAQQETQEETKTVKQSKNKKYEEFSTGNLEDALTKIIKLLANLSTEEKIASSEFSEI